MKDEYDFSNGKRGAIAPKGTTVMGKKLYLHEMKYFIEKIRYQLMWFLLKKVPKKVLYYMVIQAWAIATTTKFRDKQPDDVTFSDVCRMLE